LTEVTEKRRPISAEIEENKTYLNEKLGVGVSFDVGVHDFYVGSTRVLLYYINGFADSELLTEILQELNDLRNRETSENLFDHLLHKYIPFFQLTVVNTTDEFMDKLLSGMVGLIIDQSSRAIVMDTKVLPGRSPEEPDTERIVRGAHDGFTESLVTNCVLTRRRIRDERLRFEIMRIGKRTKTDVSLSYIKDIANPRLVETLRQRLKEIDIDGIPMAEKTIEEFIIGQTFNPYPLVRYTERPDVAAVHLLEGHVLIYVDTSPSVMITPATYFHHVQHAEEYRQTPAVGAYLRWVRFFGIFFSVFLLPIWLTLVLKPSLIPESLDFLGLKKPGSIPLLAQFIIAELGLDLMRMAAIHTPAPLSVALGLLAAILVGEVAINVGLLAPETILYLAVAAVGMFATPSYELSQANRLVRLFLVLMAGIFSVPGLMIGLLLVLIALASTRSLNTPYLWPFIPFEYKAFKDVLVRLAVPYKNNRPSIVRSQDSSRQ